VSFQTARTCKGEGAWEGEEAKKQASSAAADVPPFAIFQANSAAQDLASRPEGRDAGMIDADAWLVLLCVMII
jgi:hypothetical protein